MYAITWCITVRFIVFCNGKRRSKTDSNSCRVIIAMSSILGKTISIYYYKKTI